MRRSWFVTQNAPGSHRCTPSSGWSARGALSLGAVDKPPALIGLISDTHGLLRQEAVRALRGSELIIHAGDVGSPEIIDALQELAPVVAVRGNTDSGPWARSLPRTAVAHAGPISIYVLHDLRRLVLDPVAAGFQAVVSGHSHNPNKQEHAGVLYINPGSAGPRRFRLPVTVARLDVRAKLWKLEFVEVEKTP